MPIHIVPLKPQPSLAKSRLVCVMKVSDWPQIWDSRLYTKLFLRFMLLCCGGLYVKTNMEKSPTACGHWPYKSVLILSLLTWSDLNYWSELLFCRGCQGNAWRSKQWNLQIWAGKGIMWQLQITVEIENKTSQLLIIFCFTFFQNRGWEESGCDFLLSCPLLYNMFFHVCRSCLEILTARQTKLFFFFLTIVAPPQNYC